MAILEVNVRGIGLVKHVRDIDKVVIKTQNGPARRMNDIGVVTQGPKIRLGQIVKVVHRKTAWSSTTTPSWKASCFSPEVRTQRPCWAAIVAGHSGVAILRSPESSWGRNRRLAQTSSHRSKYRFSPASRNPGSGRDPVRSASC